MRTAAIYARVSSDQQREAHTITSQTAALIEWATTLALEVPKAWIIEDERYKRGHARTVRFGARAGFAAEGQIQAVLVFSPGR
jgi:site-specific DNA recombinase